MIPNKTNITIDNTQNNFKYNNIFSRIKNLHYLMWIEGHRIYRLVESIFSYISSFHYKNNIVIIH